MGLYRAGFDVVGVDIKPQPRYPFPFIQADALKPPVRLEDFDLVWASPPCQAFTPLRWMHNARDNPDLVYAVRLMLSSFEVQESGTLWVIENVRDARLRATARLCGTAFGLGVSGAELRRHRYFESNYAILMPPCNHHAPRVIGVYGGHGRDHRRHQSCQDFPTSERRAAMGIDWMTGAELSEAVPPAYSEHIGRYAMMALGLVSA